MTAIVVSTLAYFIAAYYIKRRLDDMDIPKGMTRATLIFVLAALPAYAAAYLVGLFAS